jgi:hypothetical protein
LRRGAWILSLVALLALWPLTRRIVRVRGVSRSVA